MGDGVALTSAFPDGFFHLNQAREHGGRRLASGTIEFVSLMSHMRFAREFPLKLFADFG